MEWNVHYKRESAASRKSDMRKWLHAYTDVHTWDTYVCVDAHIHNQILTRIIIIKIPAHHSTTTTGRACIQSLLPYKIIRGVLSKMLKRFHLPSDVIGAGAFLQYFLAKLPDRMVVKTLALDKAVHGIQHIYLPARPVVIAAVTSLYTYNRGEG